MRGRLFVITFAFVLFFTANVLANINIEASLDSPQIAIDEDVTLIVSVSGNLNIADPVVPPVQGLKIVQTGRTSQIQIINGSMTITAQYLYTVIPQEEGKFTIPPFVVQHQGKEYKSNSLDLTVSRNAYTGTPQPAPGNTPSQQQVPVEESPRFWITATVNNTNPYLSEQILYTFKLYTRENITQAAPELPPFTDFWSDVVVSDQRGTEVINGTNYATWEKVIALVPLKEGKIAIDKAHLDLVYEVYDHPTRPLNRWDPFFNNSFFNRGFAQTKQASLKSHALEIDVKPLPKPYPDNFTGLVGEFGLQASLSEQSISADESITLELSLSGTGNVKDATLPEFSLKGFKTYFDKPVVDLHKSEKGFSGKKTFKIVLVPLTDGPQTLPELNLSFFSLEKNDYVRATVPAQQIEVTPSTEQKTNSVITPSPVTGADETVTYKDIAPIFSSPNEVLGRTSLQLDQKIFAVVFYGLPLFLFLSALAKIIRKRVGRDDRKIRRKEAYQSLLSRLKDRGVTGNEILEGVQNYVSAAFDVKGQALTAQEIQAVCLKNKIPEKLAQGLGAAIQQIESAQYGFDKEMVVGRVSREIKNIVEEIHRRMK